MSLSKRSIDVLTDLLENKLSCMQVYDRDDSRELAILEQCRRELLALRNPTGDTTVVRFPEGEGKRRGRKARIAV